MKCTIVIDPSREEEICIFAKERTPLIDEIEQLAAEETVPLIGYDADKVAVPLNLTDIYCFSVQDNKVYAHVGKAVLSVRARLYQIEKALPERFVKINQSCIVNIRKIQRFDAALSGTLRVTLTNGYTDFVSRRQLKIVKERLGLFK